MNKLNLCNNDIIVILIIFIVFCIFMFINTKYTYENFQVITNSKKHEYIDLVDNFIIYIETYMDSLKEINIQYIKIFEKIKPMPPKSYNEIINSFVDSNNNTFLVFIKSYLNNINNLKFDKKINNQLSDNFTNIFNTNKNKLYSEYNKLFNSTSNKSINICGMNIKYEKDSRNFFRNINSKLDVILLSNKSSLDFLTIYINNIINIINKLEFKPSFKEKLLDYFDNYLKLLNEMYNNKHNFNMINILSHIFLETEKGDEGKTQCLEGTKGKKRVELIKTLEKNYNTYNRHLNNISYIISTIKKINDDLKTILIKRNINDIFIVYSDDSNYFNDAKKKLELETNFCSKLKKLDKPNKNNLILKRFTDDLIDKKFKYINKLESKIKNIQEFMTNKELYDYNLNRIRTHEESNKQYKAISKGIENIKNNNKVKINLT